MYASIRPLDEWIENKTYILHIKKELKQKNNTQTREKVNLIHTNHNDDYIRCEKVNKNKQKNMENNAKL